MLYRYKNLRENFTSFSNCAVHRPNQTLRLNPSAIMRAQLHKKSDCVIHLVKEIGDIKKYKIEQGNCFLYDDSNTIETTFFSELNKKIQTHGLISYFSDNEKNIARLITSQKRLKFIVKSKNYKENIVLQLVSIKRENVIIKKNRNKINNFGI